MSLFRLLDSINWRDLVAPGMTPEQTAREKIDQMLPQCGWALQHLNALNLAAARGVVLREVMIKSGRCDYLLLVDRRPVRVIEAKGMGTTLSGIAEQYGHCPENLPDFLAALTSGKLCVRWQRLEEPNLTLAA